MFSKNKKLDPRVRYQTSQFKNKLTRARTYQRKPGQLAHLFRLVRGLRVSRQGFLLGLLGLVVLLCCAYMVYVPNIFFIRTVRLVGARSELEAELRGQVDRFLIGQYYTFPKRNLLTLPAQELTQYILAVNPGVWHVSTVKKHFPNTLEITIVPRDAAFIVSTETGSYMVANDGLVLPPGEQGTNILAVTARGLKEPVVGEQYFSDAILTTLIAIRKDFVAKTGLPHPEQVVLSPSKVFVQDVTSPLTGQLPAATVSISTTLNAPASTEQVPPSEILVKVPGGQTSPFSLLFSVTESMDEVFEQLRVLIQNQSQDRLQNLAYIDMRFPSKAFICLVNTPCASAIQAQ